MTSCNLIWQCEERLQNTLSTSLILSAALYFSQLRFSTSEKWLKEEHHLMSSHLIALASRVSLPKAGELSLSFTKYLYLSEFVGSCFFLMPAPGSEKFANLSVSALQHEVIAVTFSPTDSSFEFLVAGNKQVPITTTEHIGSL